MQAINATTMPKVVICHTPVIHNHYMECNAPKLPGVGGCCDSVCPWVSYGLARYSHFHIYSQTHRHKQKKKKDMALFPVICGAYFFSCLLLSVSSSVVAFM